MPTVGNITVTDEQMKNPRIRRLFLEAQVADAGVSLAKTQQNPFITTFGQDVKKQEPVAPLEVIKGLPKASLDVVGRYVEPSVASPFLVKPTEKTKGIIKDTAKDLLVKAPTKIVTSLVSDRFREPVRSGSNLLRSSTGIEEPTTTYAEDAIKLVREGQPAWLASLSVGSKAILDTAITGDIISASAKGIASGLKVAPEGQLRAWEALGMPDSISTARQNYFSLARQFHPDFGGNAETFARINEAYDVLSKTGIPANPNGLIQQFRSAAEVINKPVSELGVKRVGEAPIGAKQLPGYRPINPELRPVGLSTQPVEPVGFGGKEVVKKSVDPLLTEARKYKSAEEFVNSRGKKFVHETDAPNIKEFTLGKAGANTEDSWLGRGVYFQEDGAFKIEKYGKNKVETYISPEAKIFEIKDTPNGKWRDNFVEEVAKKNPDFEKGLEEWRNPKNVLPRDFLMNKSPEEIKKLIGDYDGILQDGELVVFNPKVIKTKSQLTDIWKKAQEAQPIDDFIPDTLSVNAQNALDQTTFEVFTQLELSQAGERVFIDGEVSGVPSTFPDWLPKELRSKKLIDLVSQRLQNGEPLKGSKQKALAEVISKRIAENIPVELRDELALSTIAKEDIARMEREELEAYQEILLRARQILKNIPTQKTTTGTQTKKVINQTVAPTPRSITKTEPQLLKAQIRAEARTAKIVAKNVRLETKATLLEEFRNKSADIQLMRTKVINYAKENLPLHEQGKLITMVRNTITPLDLSKAFLRIDAMVEKIELNSAISDLKATISKISDSSSISADYKNLINKVVDEYELTGHSEKTLEKLRETQEFIDRARAIGEDVSIPSRIIEKLQILQRTPKEELTLEIVTKLKNEVDLLIQLGETKFRTRESLYESEKNLRMEQLLETASPMQSKEVVKPALGVAPQKTDAWVNKFIEARNYIQKTRVGLMPMDGFAEVTGMTPMKDALDLNFGNYLSFNDIRFRELDDLIKKYELTETDFKVVGAFAITKQEGGLERLVANNGLSEEELKNLDLSVGQKELYKFIITENEAVYPALKRWALDVYNTDVGKVDNYVSFHTNFDEMNDLAMYDKFGRRPEEIQGGMRTKNVESGFTQKRQSMSRNPLELDVVKVFERHMDDVAYSLTMGRDTKMYFEIVNTPAMKGKLGDVGALAWLEWLDLMARKGGMDAGKRIAALDVLRKNISVGVLGFRLSSMLVQFTSFADTVATIGAEYATQGASKMATSREWREFVLNNFPEIRKAIGDDVAFREFGDGMLGKLGNTSMKPLQFMDGLMRSTAAIGSYIKLATERGITIDLANPVPELIAEATKLVRQSQGSSFFKDQPLAISKGFGLTENRSVNKTILTFQSFMLNRWDNIKRQIWRVGIKEKNYKKAIGAFFWFFVFATAMEEGIRRGTKKAISFVFQNEAPENDPFILSMIQNSFQTVPIAGSLISSLQYSSSPVPLIKTTQDVISGLSSAFTGKATRTKVRGAVKAAGAVGSLIGIPGSSQAAQLIRDSIEPAKPSGGSSNNPFL